MHGLEAVARIGQRARHDHAHGVIEIGFAHLGINVHLLDITIIIGLDCFFSHSFLFRGGFGIKKTRRTRFCDSAS